MAVYYIIDDTLSLYVQRGELTPPRRSRFGNKQYWPLVTLNVLSDKEEELYPVTCFTMHVDMLPAVQKIFVHRKAACEELTQVEVEERVADVIAGDARMLNALDKVVAIQ